jgi:DNA-binding NtrC family response regulator
MYIFETLQRDDGLEVQQTGTIESGAAADLVIPVVPDSPKEAGEFLESLLASQVTAPVLPVLGPEMLNRYSQQIGRIGRDFVLTPVREAELRVRVQQGLQAAPPAPRAEEEFGLHHLVGEAPAFVAVKESLAPMAQSGLTVLLYGETGCGKEMCARALHYLSRRASKPFLPVNCGAIPADLFENELFGHERGAFTSAWTKQTGLVAEAEGGTLFLDEIEALSPAGQVKLLRFLQDQTYFSVGSPKPKRANVRIIASTNVDLAGRTRQGAFREDLYHRLAVLVLTLPPLRERRSDIPRLADYFWQKHAAEHGRSAVTWSTGALEVMRNHAWQGNVRELQNVIQRLLVLSRGDVIQADDLPFPHPQPGPAVQEMPRGSLKQAKARIIEQFERAYLSSLLRAHAGNITRAAREAQKERRSFGRLIKKYQIACD